MGALLHITRGCPVLDEVARRYAPGPYCRLCGLFQDSWCPNHHIEEQKEDAA